MKRARFVLALASVGALIAAAAVLAFGGGDEQADARMVMPNALGLREGADVRVGGVSAGKVSRLDLTRDDKVRIDLALENGVRIGSGASVTIKALNLLGEKYVALDPGKPAGDPGFVIPASRVTTAVDLDQVLDVLDADTRTRLAILINESGLAVAGRGKDLNALLGKLPPTLSATNRLLDDVVADNHTLARLIANTDGFLARTVRASDDLGRLVDTAAAAATTFAQRRDALGATLREAPGGLAQLRGFLAELRVTAPPLGRASRTLAATAPALRDTLAAVEPFRAAARPVLAKATEVAPSLSRLAGGATPVVRRSVPTLRSLERFAGSSRPLTQTLGRAMPDLLGVLEGWGRAIQGRDNRGHVFHGGVTFGPNFAQSLFPSLTPDARTKRRTQPQRQATPAQTAPANPAPAQRLPLLGDKVPKILQQLQETLNTATQPLQQPLKDVDKSAGGAQHLLDYLLDK